MVKVKVIGAAGFGGIGIVEMLLRHPEAEIVSLVDLEGPRRLEEFFPHLRGCCDLVVQVAGEEEDEVQPDLVFMATPDGVGMSLAKDYLERGVKVIDYSGDFRFRDPAEHQRWYGFEHQAPDLLPRAVYGLPELNRTAIAQADLVANPGCFAVGAILGWLPAVKADLVELDSLICDGKSGVSGAGKKPTPVHHFPVRNENLSAYSIVGHRHTGEIEAQLTLVVERPIRVTFTPQVGPWTRGILSTLYGTLRREISATEVRALYEEFYRKEPFVRILPEGENPGLLSVRASNFCDLSVHVDPRTRRLIVITCLDNLMKGQAGNALQNMNLMFGLPETMGLERPAVYP
ncbi:MAG TPA: N-acetyl-gamma-glutamyl-phosphate reductase [Armatimonadetes bacterium]|nr:N-acetyl-gamma-glutamyl-phosphate reductase [Armatimonadota bacterium]